MLHGLCWWQVFAPGEGGRMHFKRCIGEDGEREMVELELEREVASSGPERGPTGGFGMDLERADGQAVTADGRASAKVIECTSGPNASRVRPGDLFVSIDGEDCAGDHVKAIDSLRNANPDAPVPCVVSRRPQDAPGCFREPIGVAFVRDMLVVSEGAGRRVQVLTPEGVPLQVLPFDDDLSGISARDGRVWVASPYENGGFDEHGHYQQGAVHMLELIPRGAPASDDKVTTHTVAAGEAGGAPAGPV